MAITFPRDVVLSAGRTSAAARQACRDGFRVRCPPERASIRPTASCARSSARSCTWRRPLSRRRDARDRRRAALRASDAAFPPRGGSFGGAARGAARRAERARAPADRTRSPRRELKKVATCEGAESARGRARELDARSRARARIVASARRAALAADRARGRVQRAQARSNAEFSMVAARGPARANGRRRCAAAPAELDARGTKSLGCGRARPRDLRRARDDERADEAVP